MLRNTKWGFISATNTLTTLTYCHTLKTHCITLVSISPLCHCEVDDLSHRLEHSRLKWSLKGQIYSEVTVVKFCCEIPHAVSQWIFLILVVGLCIKMYALQFCGCSALYISTSLLINPRVCVLISTPVMPTSIHVAYGARNTHVPTNKQSERNYHSHCYQRMPLCCASERSNVHL